MYVCSGIPREIRKYLSVLLSTIRPALYIYLTRGWLARSIEDLRWAWLLTCRPWKRLPSAILSGKKRTARARCEWHNRSCWLQMTEQAADSRIIFSSYVENLEETAKVRYNEKLAMLGGAQDPYLTHQVPRRVC